MKLDEEITPEGAKEIVNYFNQRITELRSVVQLSSTNGNHDTDYLLGMANGVILALAIMENEQPNFLNPPKKSFSSKVMDLGDIKI